MTDNLDGVTHAEVEYTPAISEAALAIPSAVDLTDEEETLKKRYTNRWTKKSEELVFEFTRDPALLHQYYRIYEEQFIAIYKARSFRVVESDYDRSGHILVARQGNFCVGGARISISTPRSPNLLPLEIDGFRLSKHFKSLEQKQLRYGQLSRFVLLPEFRGGNVTREMFRKLYRKVVTLNLDMVFAAAPMANARAYRLNCVEMGLEEVKIHMDIELPDYEAIKQYLISGIIDKSLIKKQPLSGQVEENERFEQV